MFFLTGEYKCVEQDQKAMVEIYDIIMRKNSREPLINNIKMCADDI